MGDLAARGEVVKLARELDVPVASLQFLQHQPASDLAAFRRAVTTEIAPAGEFFYAEADHQQYLAKNPNGYRCHSSTGVTFPSDAFTES